MRRRARNQVIDPVRQGRAGGAPARRRARIQAIDHIHLDVPYGSAQSMRSFYSGLLGLPELNMPAGETPEDGVVICFGANSLQMRLIVRERPNVRPSRRRLTVEVDSLEELAARLDQSKVEYWRYRGLWFTDQRVLVRDPVGHLVELRQNWDI